jgi:hypothetical protein
MSCGPVLVDLLCPYRETFLLYSLELESPRIGC